MNEFQEMREKEVAKPVKEASDDALIEELRARGYLPMIWSLEDVRGIVDMDDICDRMDEEQIEFAVKTLFEDALAGLEELTAQRGNDHLADKWAFETRGKVLAELGIAAPAHD